MQWRQEKLRLAGTVMGRSRRISVRVKPRSSRDEVVSYDAAARSMEIRVKAPPVDNAANKAVVNLLAKTFKVPKSKVWIVKGANSRDKIVEIEADELILERFGGS